MFTAYVVVTALTAAANTFAATVDFTRPDWLLRNMAKARVPQSWLFSLGALKAAGALGLLIGIGLPLLGVAASVGLVLFFIGALITHFRARYWAIAPRSLSSCWPWARWSCDWLRSDRVFRPGHDACSGGLQTQHANADLIAALETHDARASGELY